jgi:hypothetical protein
MLNFNQRHARFAFELNIMVTNTAESSRMPMAARER